MTTLLEKALAQQGEVTAARGSSESIEENLDAAIAHMHRRISSKQLRAALDKGTTGQNISQWVNAAFARAYRAGLLIRAPQEKK